MNHQPLSNAQVLHWPFVFLVSFPFFLIFLSMFGMAVLDRLYPPQQAPRKQQDSFLERQTRAAELTALVAYTRNCGDRKHEGISGEFDEVGEAMTRLALGVVAGGEAEKDEKRGMRVVVLCREYKGWGNVRMVLQKGLDEGIMDGALKIKDVGEFYTNGVIDVEKFRYWNNGNCQRDDV